MILINFTHLKGMSITGDRITTKVGSITFSELINLSHNYKILRNVYIFSTVSIITYLIYEKKSYEHTSL